MDSITNQVISPDEFGFVPIFAINSNGMVVAKLKYPNKVLNVSKATSR